MKIDNPYHNPFCDHKTHRDHTATHHIFCHKEYTTPATPFLIISHLATLLLYLCDRNREDTHARDT